MVTVIGLGFVGLTTALGLCEFGNTVYGIDTNNILVEQLKKTSVPFMEPFIPEKLSQYLNTSFYLDRTLEEAVRDSEAVFICVGTPYGENGSADLTYIFSAIDEIIACIKDDKYRTIVIKSTIPPSTTANRIIPYIKSKGMAVPDQIGVATNPEFLREGHCFEDFVHCDRIVIGTEDKRSEDILRKTYAKVNSPILTVSYNTSEFIKYLSNSVLACLISFSNEMSMAADAIGDIDIASAFKIVGMDKRWQTGSIRSYFYPGCGYGGYCLPKDTNALYSLAESAGFDCRMLKDIIKINDNMPKETARKIVSLIPDDRKDMCIGILGLSFNVGSDDVRDASAAKIIKCLNEMGYTNICGFDPVATEKFRRMYSDLECSYTADYENILNTADVLVLVTPWEMFKNIKDTGKEIVDCRYAL